ncbi:MAG: hypothetical protein AABY22_32920 [Nanoarchaeota archaeon]
MEKIFEDNLTTHEEEMIDVGLGVYETHLLLKNKPQWIREIENSLSSWKKDNETIIL